MLKLIHAADFHIDGDFTALTPERARVRAGEQRHLLHLFQSAVVEREVDLVVIAGDLLHGSRVSLEMVELVMETLRELPCPVFISPGNHDYYHDKSPYFMFKWPDNVHIFTSSLATCKEITVRDETVCIYGAAFTDSTKDTSPLANLQGAKDWSNYHIMVAHGEVDGEKFGSMSTEEIIGCGMHYLALGHVHTRTAPQRLGNTYYTYAGCAQGRNFAETEAKGVLYLEIERTGEANMAFIPLHSRQYHMVAVDISRQRDFTESLRKSLLGRYPGAKEEIFCIILKGESSGVDVRALERALEQDFFGIEVVD
ncbi:MAG: metallophosphoesterase, partial [Eubacteriales bacterium]